ncbi:hypothetical protein MHBO_005276, partial [Bonamia ostreae]
HTMYLSFYGLSLAIVYHVGVPKIMSLPLLNSSTTNVMIIFTCPALQNTLYPPEYTLLSEGVHFGKH